MRLGLYLVPEVDFELLGESLGDHGVSGDGGGHHGVRGHQPAQPETSEASGLIMKMINHPNYNYFKTVVIMKIRNTVNSAGIM